MSDNNSIHYGCTTSGQFIEFQLGRSAKTSHVDCSATLQSGSDFFMIIVIIQLHFCMIIVKTQILELCPFSKERVQNCDFRVVLHIPPP